MMAIAAGRFIADGDILFAGTGVALLAAGCAKRVHAPGAVVFVETGGIDPSLDEIPLAVADSRVMDGTCINAGIIEAFSYIANPRLHTIAFLGAAQIDRFGNLNSTCIGDYDAPTVRFSGSGGACDAASLASGLHRLHAARAAQVRREARLRDQPRLARGRRQPPPRRLRPRRPDRRRHRPGGAQVRRARRRRCTSPRPTPV